MSDIKNAAEFMRGQKDCQDGKDCRETTEDYLRGYSCEYQHMENMSHASDLLYGEAK